MSISCILAPYLLAFGTDDNSGFIFYLDQSMNAFFIIDVVINFFSAYYDEDLEIIDDRKVLLNLFFIIIDNHL